MNKKEVAVIAAGCFWCTEAIFQRLKGVQKVVAGYAGGKMENPTYEKVSAGITGHAESIQITFDPSVISYKDILEVFFKTHDPTQKDGQGADIGIQYRSIIFYTNESQKKNAEQALEDAQKDHVKEIVTEIFPLGTFHMAEKYHQNFYNNNRENSYCKLVIDPKIKKLYKNFKPQVVQV